MMMNQVSNNIDMFVQHEGIISSGFGRYSCFMLNNNSFSFSEVLSCLEEQLKQSMPGTESHLAMAPQPLDKARFDVTHREKARVGGVLILLYEEEGELKFPLTERPQYNGVHSGQISLPGGKVEPDDEDIIHTAKRETREEIGVPEEDVKIIGQLSEIYIPPSNFRVKPIVGYTETKPNFLSESEEVVTLIETDVLAILNPNSRKEKQVKAPKGGYDMFVPYFDIQGHTVWGATAMILSEFADVLKSTGFYK